MLFALPIGISVTFFQNCSPVRNGTTANEESSKGGGTGTDGKTFASYGQCPDGSVGVSSVVQIPDDQRAFLVRRNCQSLATPQLISLTDLKFAAKDSSVMTLNGQVFDQQTSAPKVTMELCQSSNSSPAVESQVWQVSGDASSLFGSISRADGVATGILRVALPSASAPLDFITASGQSSSFSLRLANPSSGSLTYSINGAAQVSVPTVSCLYQPLPGAFPNANNTGVPKNTVLSASGSITVTTDGTVIDAKLINGCVSVQANNVTIKNSRILGGNCARPVNINAPYSGLLVVDSEIDGQNTATCSEIIGGGGYTLQRVHAHGCDQGPRLVGPLSITIQDSYIANRNHGSQAYRLTLNAGHSIKFIHNTIETANGPAIFTADYSTGDLILDSNLLVGTNYVLSLYDNRAWVRNNLIFDNSDGSYSSYFSAVRAWFGDGSDPGTTIMEWSNNRLTSKRDGSAVGALISQPAP